MPTLRRIFCGLLLLSPLLLANCAALTTAIEHQDLVVGTQMSTTIFLDPVSPAQKSIYVDVRNTTDKPIDLSMIDSLLQAKGYRLVDDPARAYYVLQVNSLYVGRTSQSAAQQTLLNGYGGSLVGGYAGAMIGASIASNAWAGAGWGGVAGGLAGMALETILNAAVQDVTYTIITDVQISEKTRKPISQVRTANVMQGTSSTVQQWESGTANGRLYRTRVISEANKVNLDFAAALPELQYKLAQSIAGIF